MRSIILGLSIAAPVGAIGVLIIRRTLADGGWAGFISGLGAATADALYGTIAALGLTAITTFLTDLSPLIRLMGGVFLLYLGYRTLIAVPPAAPAQAASRGTLASAYFSVLALTLTNPMTIVAFIGIFAGLGAAASGTAGAVITVLGIFVGSALWWLVLAGGVSLLRARFTARWMLWVNRISGVIIIAFALVIWHDLFLGG